MNLSILKRTSSYYNAHEPCGCLLKLPRCFFNSFLVITDKNNANYHAWNVPANNSHIILAQLIKCTGKQWTHIVISTLVTRIFLALLFFIKINFVSFFIFKANYTKNKKRIIVQIEVQYWLLWMQKGTPKKLYPNHIKRGRMSQWLSGDIPM